MPELSIGTLSRRTGVHIETIRYFEKVGLLDTPGRTDGGHRVYSERHVRALTFIKRARELGFAPAEVRTMLSLGGPARKLAKLAKPTVRMNKRGRASTSSTL